MGLCLHRPINGFARRWWRSQPSGGHTGDYNWWRQIVAVTGCVDGWRAVSVVGCRPRGIGHRLLSPAGADPSEIYRPGRDVSGGTDRGSCRCSASDANSTDRGPTRVVRCCSAVPSDANSTLMAHTSPATDQFPFSRCGNW